MCTTQSKMNCPICKHSLFYRGKNYIDNLTPNPLLVKMYKCKNSECDAFQDGIEWDERGEIYGNIGKINKAKFIHKNDAPFNSIQRRLNVEINKQGVRDRKELSRWLCLGFRKPIIEYKYNADERGNILNSTWKLIFVKP